MPLLTRTMVGASALTAAFVGGVAAAGGFDGTEPVLRRTAVTGPDVLRPAQDCTALLDWYVRRNLDDVGPFGWRAPDVWRNGGPVERRFAFGADEQAVPSPTAPSPTDARSSSETGTNTQEAGVDEPDTAKTDGHRVVHLEGADVVITEVSGPRPRRVGAHRLPEGLRGELLLVGEHVLVVVPGHGAWYAGKGPGPDSSGPAQVIDIDISDPSDPRLESITKYDGVIESVRQYDGDVVRVVVEKPRPEFRWAYPHDDVSEDEARDRNRALVAGSDIEDWLPREGGETVDCSDVHLPEKASGEGTVGVFTREVGSARRSAVAIAAGAGFVYSSPDRLYVATSDLAFDVWRWGVGRVTGRPIAPEEHTTRIHAFELDGAETSYVASGHVPGIVRDRWSLDEEDGLLRIAFARPGNGSPAVDNAVGVLDGELQPLGSVTGLGIDEDIQSVRWFDDVAVVVTFRQIDPLYTLSFADPAAPRLLGELKIPGFSAYLHPLGDGRLLGLGQDATEQGGRLGAQAALFDISALTDPRQVARHRFDQGSELIAGADPRAFTWVPDGAGGTGYTLLRRGWWAPLSGGPEVRSIAPAPPDEQGGLVPVALRVDGHRLTVSTLEAPADEQTRILPIAGGRVVLVGPELTILG